MRLIVSKALALVMASCGLVACRGEAGDVAAAGATTASTLRTDGAYYLVRETSKDASGAPECVAVRFLPDQSLLEASYFGSPGELLGRFEPGREGVLTGRWSLTGDELVAVVGRAFEESTRSGKLTGDGWRVTEKVVWENGWKLTDVDASMRFVRLPFPAIPPAARNRPPVFNGSGKMVRSFDYDRAGNLKGIRQEMETAATDPDGDPVAFTWSATNGTLSAEGRKAVWQRVLKDGRPVPGAVTIEISDGRDGKVRLRRSME